ncbi:MAG: catechol 2,3-dioxygenase-like lactoylglutathione lyase family enzyme, partial [Saprospiraceae bacterium]
MSTTKPFTNLSFDHVHYRSSDFDKTKNFYITIMGGIELNPEILLKKPNLQIELAGVTLLFAQAGDDHAPPIPAKKRLGVYHIAFLVDDCDAATKYYRKKGAKVAIKPFMAAKNIKASFLYAPDGMWV